MNMGREVCRRLRETDNLLFGVRMGAPKAERQRADDEKPRPRRTKRRPQPKAPAATVSAGAPNNGTTSSPGGSPTSCSRSNGPPHHRRGRTTGAQFRSGLSCACLGRPTSAASLRGGIRRMPSDRKPNPGHSSEVRSRRRSPGSTSTAVAVAGAATSVSVPISVVPTTCAGWAATEAHERDQES